MPAINLSLPCKRLQEQSYSGGGNLYLAGLHGPGLPIRYHRVHLIFIIISGQGASDMASVLLIYPYFDTPNNRLSLIHISEPTRLGMISYAVFCLKKKKKLS